MSQYLTLNQEFERPDSGVGHPGSGAPFGIYKTKDDYITIAVASLEDLSEILEDENLKNIVKDLVEQWDLIFKLKKEMKFFTILKT